MKVFWRSIFAYQILNFEPDTGLKSHSIGEWCSQSHATPPKDQAESDGTCETSTQPEGFGGLGGLEEYKDNLKKQEQNLKQQLQELKIEQTR